jgi:DNA-binding protein HU-beta
MNKGDFARVISEKSNFTLKDPEKFLNAFMDATIEVLKKGDEVSLVGFGSFSVVKRAAMKVMDFKAKKQIKIPAFKRVRFKQGKNLKDAANS